MKAFIVLVFLSPLALFAQKCPSWINAPVDSAVALVPTIQQYLKFPLKETKNNNYTQWTDSLGFCQVKIDFNTKRELVGTAIESQLTGTRRIYISGPAPRIEQLLQEYFQPAVKPCITKESPTWMFWDNYMLVHRDNGQHEGVPLKSIIIEKR